jgi:3-hydroxyisobutyrate dehydrogenase-like beta-hydroxyacid dehydrogenase
VIVSLFSDAQLREVLLDGGALSAMRAGSTLITHVTGSPDLVVELDARAPAGVRVVDGPMSGTADSIQNGRLTLLLGGDAEDIERVRPVLATYADNILHVGAIGDAQRVKLINNLLFTVNLQMALAAAKLGEAMSIAPSTLAKTLATCSGNSFALALFERMQPETMKASARPFLVKDIAVVQDVATSMGIDLGILGQLADWVNHD